MIHTVGHSNRTLDAFLDLLRAHGVEQIADVRMIPHSRRHPQFAQAALAASLAGHGMAYRHFPGLGGRRTPGRDSRNTAWRHPAFRGYADYMQTAPFRESLDALLAVIGAQRTAVMCAEAVWWQCHRRLLADALLVRGVPVLHILSPAPAKPHELSQFARPDGDTVTYPGLLDS